jgi:hypothetical protein
MSRALSSAMLLFGFALLAGLLLTPERRLLASGWLVAGGAAAFAIFLPNLLWMDRHGFPILELLSNIRRDHRDVSFNPLQFLTLQAILQNPATLPVWLAGLWRLLATREARHFRAFGFAWLITLAILLALAGKVYYISSAYPMLLAAGAISAEEVLSGPGRRWARTAYAALLLAAGALLAPTALPMFTPSSYLRFMRLFHVSQPRLENRASSEMPQFFADRFGWPEMAATVAKAYGNLPPEERKRTAVFGNDYGQAGAIDFYGPRLGLPKAIGGHLSYWYWGPRGYTGESVLVLGDRRDVLDREFGSVRAVAEVGHPYAMRQEHFTVFLCRDPKGWTFQQIWPRLKNFH